LISLSDGNIDDWNNDSGLSSLIPDSIDDWNTDSGLSSLNLDAIDHWMVETHPQPLTVDNADEWTVVPDPNPLIADSIDDDWMIAVDPNWSFVDNQNSDENFLLAGNSDCDSSYADDIQLVGKVRRENSCRNPPVGQSDQPQQPPDEPFDFRVFLYGKALEIFPADSDVCPPSIFRTANTPVCKPRRYATTGVFGEAWVNLQGVKPPVLFSDPKRCADGSLLWCCKQISVSPKEQIENVLGADDIDLLAEMDPTALLEVMLLGRFRYNAYVCFDQELIFGDIVDEFD
jgi:hypothetical protein